MTSLSSLPQLLAILDNLVEVSDLTDEERLWVYDKFASRTGKGPTRKEAVAPAMNAYTFLMRKNPSSILTTALPLPPVKKAKVSRSGKNEKAGVLLINNLREASRLRHGGQERAANALVTLSFPEVITEDKTLSATLHRHRKGDIQFSRVKRNESQIDEYIMLSDLFLCCDSIATIPVP